MFDMYCVCILSLPVWLLYGVEAAEKRELERKKTEEKATLKKLQKLIEKERERKKKPSSKKTKR